MIADISDPVVSGRVLAGRSAWLAPNERQQIVLALRLLLPVPSLTDGGECWQARTSLEAAAIPTVRLMPRRHW